MSDVNNISDVNNLVVGDNIPDVIIVDGFFSNNSLRNLPKLFPTHYNFFMRVKSKATLLIVYYTACMLHPNLFEGEKI
jgi:hypothetical protein